MRQMQLSEYCHEIDHMDADRLIGQFRKLEANREAVKRTIGQGVDQARAALDEQYDILFGELMTVRRAVNGAASRRRGSRVGGWRRHSLA